MYTTNCLLFPTERPVSFIASHLFVPTESPGPFHQMYTQISPYRNQGADESLSLCAGQHLDRRVERQAAEGVQPGVDRGDDALSVGHPHLLFLHAGAASV